MKTTEIQIKASGMVFTALQAGPPDGSLILFLHGFPQFADAWLPWLEAFAKKGFRALAVDQRGYSRTARPIARMDYNMGSLTQDVLNIADALGVKRFHVIGHDWGGIVAWHLAASAPDRLLSLCVLSVPHPAALARALSKDWDQKLRSSYMFVFRRPGLAERLLKARDWMLLRSMYQGRVPKAQVQRNIERLGEEHTLTSALNWYRAYDDGATGMVRVPSLYIRGSKDLALGPEAAAMTAEYVPGEYRYIELGGFTHWLIDEYPERLIGLVLPFVLRYELGLQHS